MFYIVCFQVQCRVCAHLLTLSSTLLLSMVVWYEIMINFVHRVCYFLQKWEG